MRSPSPALASNQGRRPAATALACLAVGVVGGTPPAAARAFAAAAPAAAPAGAPAPATATAHSGDEPSWTDVPALVAAVAAPVASDLRGCVGDRLPRTLGITVARARDGRAVATLPLPGLGGRGPTAEERCLVRAVARLSFPPLPPPIERIGLAVTVTAAGARLADDPAFAAWRDPAAATASLLDDDLRAALAACSPRPRTIRLVLDLRRRATRVWLPAWQFHSPSGDGTTPPAERRVATCTKRALAALRPPPLPRPMAELELAIPVARRR